MFINGNIKRPGSHNSTLHSQHVSLIPAAVVINGQHWSSAHLREPWPYPCECPVKHSVWLWTAALVHNGSTQQAEDEQIMFCLLCSFALPQMFYSFIANNLCSFALPTQMLSGDYTSNILYVCVCVSAHGGVVWGGVFTGLTSKRGWETWDESHGDEPVKNVGGWWAWPQLSGWVCRRRSVMHNTTWEAFSCIS